MKLNNTKAQLKQVGKDLKGLYKAFNADLKTYKAVKARMKELYAEVANSNTAEAEEVGE